MDNKYMDSKRFFIGSLIFTVAMFLLFGVTDAIVFDVLWVTVCTKVNLDKYSKRVNPLYVS